MRLNMQKDKTSVLSYLLLRCVCQHPGDEYAMGDEFQPGIHKARSFGGSQDVEGIAVNRKRKS